LYTLFTKIKGLGVILILIYSSAKASLC